jgi:hypothetical protein
VIICVLFLSTAAPAKKLKKKDFKKLEGKERTFYFTSLEFAYDTKAFIHPLLDGSIKNELEDVIANLDSRFVESISVKKLKDSIENKFGITVNTAAFDMKFEDRTNNGLFTNKPEETEQFTYHSWSIPSRNNRLIVSAYLFKLGKEIKVNKIQFEFKFLKLNAKKTAFKFIGSEVSDRFTWKKPEDIYAIIKDNCFVQ